MRMLLFQSAISEARAVVSLKGGKLTLAFAQPNPGPSTIFCDEFDPGFFERGFDLRQRIEPNGSVRKTEKQS
jgi:hypothetical protein